MMGYGDGWWGMMGLWGGVAMLLFWAGIVVLAVLLVRALLPAAPQRSETDAALDILRRRYAAGEISQGEYEQARRVLDPRPAREQL